jgi:uncharacterized protein (DUF362 family)
MGTTAGVAAKLGLLQAARKEGIPVIELRHSTTKQIVINHQTYHLSVSQDALDFDGIINLPKFKAHRQATLSFAVKNLYGCVSGKRKAFRHFASSGDLAWFSQMLVANALLLKPRLNLVDAVIAAEGQGPVRGTPKSMGLILAGVDPLALDSICCRVIGFPPAELCTLSAAGKMGLTTWHPDQIEVVGESIEQVIVNDFKLPEMMPIFFSFPRLIRSCLKSWRDALVPK